MVSPDPDLFEFGIRRKLREYGIDQDDAEEYSEAVRDRVVDGDYENVDEILEDLEWLFVEDPFRIVEWSLPWSEDAEEVGEELYEVAKNTLEREEIDLPPKYDV